MKHLFSILTFLLLLTSCASLKPNSKGYSQKIDLTNIKNIEGIYPIYSLSSLLENYYFNSNNEPDTNDFIEIRYLKKTKFEFLIVENGYVIDRKKLKGKIIDGLSTS
jgi:hypothetical protein